MYYDMEIISEVVLSCWSMCLHVSDVNEEVFISPCFTFRVISTQSVVSWSLGETDKCQIQLWLLSFPFNWVDKTNLEIQHGLDTKAGGPPGD